MNHDVGRGFGHRAGEPGTVCEHQLAGGELWKCCQQLMASALERRVVIWRHAVDPKHRMAVGQQALRQMEADESGAAGDQKAHEIPHLAAAGCAWSDRRPRGGRTVLSYLDCQNSRG